MIKVDLITGFLGSGKTTFLKQYARFLMESGYNIGIIENDYGAVNVDMMLLKELEGDSCELEMIAGGCDADCHLRRFKTKLIAMGMQGFDRVIVEPSGIYDTDEFFDVLHDEPLDRWYEIGSVITIVDANITENMTEQSEYLMATQLACAGKVIFSHLDGDHKTADLSRTKSYINRIMKKYGCDRVFDKEFVEKPWEELDDNDFLGIMNSGTYIHSVEKLWFDEKEEFKSLYFMNLEITLQRLETVIRGFFRSEEYGKVFRVKGFYQCDDDNWLEINATKDGISISKILEGQNVIIVIGENLIEDRIRMSLEN